MFQDSADLLLTDIQAEEERRRLVFVEMLKKAFKESGLTPMVGESLGIERGGFWRATAEEKEKYQHPSYAKLFRWCRIMYKYAGRRHETQKYETIMHLAGYAIPQQINEALRRTTEELAIQKSPTTDTIGDMGDKSYRQRIRSATSGTKRQFKKPLDTSL